MSQRDFDTVSPASPDKRPRHDETDLHELGLLFFASQPNDPRKEGFWDMLYINLCPRLSWLSFSVFASVFLFCVFFVQLIISGVRFEGEFLEVKKTYLTNALLLSHHHVINLKQIYRLLTSLFIHASLPWLVNSVILLLIWVSWVERIFGIVRTIVIFFLTGFAGNAFGLLFSRPDEFSMGAFVGIFGLLGACLGFIIFNWKLIANRSFSRLYLFWMITLVIVFGMMLCGNETIVLIQLGGVLSGICCGIFLGRLEGQFDGGFKGFSSHEIIIMTIGLISYAVFLGICLVVILIK